MINAHHIISSPNAYGARANNLAIAKQIQIQRNTHNPNSRHRILNGTDGTFWIMPNGIAARLAQSGLEIVA